MTIHASQLLSFDYTFPVPARRLDSAAILSALRQLHANGRSLQPRALKQREPQLWVAISRQFPSYSQALSAASIRPRILKRSVVIQWNRERIVQRLLQLSALGKDLNTGAIQKYEPRLAGAIFRHFGRHDAALMAAGIDPGSVRRQRYWSKRDVLAELRQRQRRGEDLSSSHICRHASPLYGAMIRLFGNFSKALRAAGIDPALAKKPWPIVWPTEKILLEIQRFYDRWRKRHSHTDPPCPRLSGANPSLANAARNRFGSMGAALKAAGIHDPTHRPHRRWTSAEILAVLRKLHQGGIASSYKAIFVAEPNLPAAAARHFGSLGGAVKAAKLPYVRHPRSNQTTVKHWTENLVLQSIKELYAHGDDLRYRTIKQNRHPLFWAAVSLFGSYVNAVRSAGIDYWAMSQAQLARQRK